MKFGFTVNTGGFAGLHMVLNGDSSQLQPAQRKTLESLVHYKTPEHPPASARMKGASPPKKYQLDLYPESGRLHLEFEEGAVPPEIGAMLDALEEKSSLAGSS